MDNKRIKECFDLLASMDLDETEELLKMIPAIPLLSIICCGSYVLHERMLENHNKNCDSSMKI